MSDKYKLMRIREGELDFELLIFGSIDECKDYQEHDKDEEEYSAFNPSWLNPCVANWCALFILSIKSSSSISTYIIIASPFVYANIGTSKPNKRRRNIIIRKPLMHEMPTAIIIWFCTCVLTGASFGLGYFLIIKAKKRE
jgi:hypothetical protein